MREAKRKKNPRAISKGVYLFQALRAFNFRSCSRDYVHIHVEEKDFSTGYYRALMEHGILKIEARQFETDTEV